MGTSLIRAIGGFLDAAAERWLGYAAPPADRLLRSSSWAPDGRTAYCARCGATVGPGEQTPSGCAECRGSRLPWDGFVRLGAYAEPLRDWVLAVKYERRSDLGLRLGAALGRAVRDSGLVRPDRTLVVPMPMPWQRRLYRGTDHARVIAHGVADALGAPVLAMLARPHRPPQITRTASERRRTAGSGVRVRARRGGWPVRGRDLVLVDDVRTTGGSLRVAARRIRPAKPGRLIAAVLAVTDEPGRQPLEPAAEPARPT